MPCDAMRGTDLADDAARSLRPSLGGSSWALSSSSETSGPRSSSASSSRKSSSRTRRSRWSSLSRCDPSPQLRQQLGHPHRGLLVRWPMKPGPGRMRPSLVPLVLTRCYGAASTRPGGARSRSTRLCGFNAGGNYDPRCSYRRRALTTLCPGLNERIVVRADQRERETGGRSQHTRNQALRTSSLSFSAPPCMLLTWPVATPERRGWSGEGRMGP